MEKSGVIIVDKPRGVTSHDVVAACRGLLHTPKVGHAGTLDPMATGVLVIGFGSATRLLNPIVGTDKTYITTITLGATTTTDDADGEIIEQSESERMHTRAVLSSLTDKEILHAVSQLTGDIEQVPSTYSAKKINGKRAYDLAREGEDVQLKAVKITIDEFSVTDIRRREDFIEVDARITCSAGTYIRALGRDLGKILGVGGYLTMLRRTRVGLFGVDDAHTIPFTTREREFTNKTGEQITRIKAYAPQEVRSDEQLSKHIITPAQAAQATMDVRELTARQAIDISFGRPLKMTVNHPTAALYDGHLMAIIEPWKNGQVKPTAVFITSTELAALVQA